VNGYQKYIDRDTWIDNQWFVEVTKQIDGYRLSQYFGRIGVESSRMDRLDYNLSLSNADYNGGDSPTGWFIRRPGIIHGIRGCTRIRRALRLTNCGTGIATGNCAAAFSRRNDLLAEIDAEASRCSTASRLP